MTSAKRWRVFVLAAITVNLVAFFMVRLAARPAVGAGAALDVAVTVPVLYFLLIVRGGMQPLGSMLPICLLGLLRATYLAPGIARIRPAVGAAAEIAVAALVVLRVRQARARRTGPDPSDILERLAEAARETVPSRRLAAVLASEMAVFYYAFGAWRRSADVPPDALGFTVHRESCVADLFGVLAGVSVMEAGLVHAIVARWSVTAAWTLTGLSLYGAVWLVAMARAFVLRPVLLDGTHLVVRSGMMWNVRVPVSQITAVEVGSPGAGGRVDLRIPPANEPNVTVRLSPAITAHGMYGMTREIASIGLAVDDRSGFIRAVSRADGH